VAKVLVVDDDVALLRVLSVGLGSRGFEVVVARTGEQGLSLLALEQPEVTILDLGLPDLDGLEVCRRLREWSSVPLLVLSATGDEQRKVAALDAGADDYVTKPFGMRELEARLRAALRHAPRPGGEEAAVLSVGDLVLDGVHREATVSGRPLGLTAREFSLLSFLARHAGRTCTHQMILREVWGGEYGGEAQSLRAYVYRLRRKLGDRGGTRLRSVPGIGYVLVPDPGDTGAGGPATPHADAGAPGGSPAQRR